MSKTEVEKNLKDAIYDALADGLFFDDICQIVADALNTYSKEHKNG